MLDKEATLSNGKKSALSNESLMSNESSIHAQYDLVLSCNSFY